MGELRIVSVEGTIDLGRVTREEVTDTYDESYPEELQGEEYVVLQEQKGAVTFDVELEASKFGKGTKVQLDIFTAGGFRDFAMVDVPASDEPETFGYTFGPAPVQDIGTVHVVALEVTEKGNVRKVRDEQTGLLVGVPLARYDSDA